MSTKPRLLFLHTGGTLGMIRADPGPLQPSVYAENLLPFVPGLDSTADIEGRVVCNVDSTDMNPDLWEALAREIHQGLDSYDGFVVLHGTDTMAWTACALSLLLENLPRPVVLTGSQRPMPELRTDARVNLVHSALCATMDLPEVGLYFGRFLFRGNRATKASIQSYDAFASPNHPPLLEFGVDVRQHAPLLERSGAPALRTGFSRDVAVLQLFPGMAPGVLDACMSQGARAVVLRAFGEGNVPLAGWPEAIARATGAGAIVAIVSQCQQGYAHLGRYEGGARALDAGATSAGDMTTEMAVVKLMWLLGQGLEGDRLRAEFERDLVGERSEG